MQYHLKQYSRRPAGSLSALDLDLLQSYSRQSFGGCIIGSSVMHELAIAQSILEHVENAVPASEISHVRKIVVRIGGLTDVLPEALSFNFDAIKTDTCLEKAQLEIKKQAVTAHCLICGSDFNVQSYFFACPNCSSGQVEVTAGEELDIVYVEVEDEIVN